jgi:hypothetical protein
VVPRNSPRATFARIRRRLPAIATNRPTAARHRSTTTTNPPAPPPKSAARTGPARTNASDTYTNLRRPRLTVRPPLINRQGPLSSHRCQGDGLTTSLENHGDPRRTTVAGATPTRQQSHPPRTLVVTPLPGRRPHDKPREPRRPSSHRRCRSHADTTRSRAGGSSAVHQPGPPAPMCLRLVRSIRPS